MERRWLASTSATSTGYSGTSSGAVRPSRVRGCLAAACCGRRAVSVEPLVFLTVFSIFLQLTTFELYAFTREGWEIIYSVTNTSNWSCLTAHHLDREAGSGTADKVQGRVALLNLYVGVAGQVPGIASALVLGPLSDRYGRRVALGVVLAGLFLQSAVSYAVVEFNLSLLFFVLGYGVKALAGGQAGLLTVSRSLVTDVSSKRWLTLRLGLLVAVSYIASSLGLFAAGFWIGESNCKFRPVSLTILVVSAISVLYLLLFVRETLSQRSAAVQKTASVRKSLLVPFKIFFDRSRGVPLWRLWFSLVVLGITVLNQLGYFTTVILFSIHQPLQWKPGLIGIFLAGSEFIRGLSSILLLPILVASSLRDPFIALFGVCVVCLANVGTGFVHQSWQMFIAGAIQGVDAIITPALVANMSKLVPPYEQGALYSVISAVQVLSGTLAFILYSLVYKFVLERDGWPVGVPFWLMAFLYLIAIPFLLCLARKQPRRYMFVRTDYLTSTSGSPQSPNSHTSTSPPLPTPPHRHQFPPPHLRHHLLPQQQGWGDDEDQMGSIEWALSTSQAQRYQPCIISPPSIGRETLEKQSLLGHTHRPTYGSHSLSINS